MGEDPLRLRLHLDAGADADGPEVERLTRLLQREILELDVDAVTPVAAGAPPPGTRAADAVALGGLFVTLVRSPELLHAVVQAAQGWLGGRQGRSVEISIGGDTLKVGGLAPEEQRRLVELFVARHAG